MELEYWIGEKNRTPIWKWQKNPETVKKNWESEGVLWVLPAQSPVFLNAPVLGYRNNLHNIYGENEKEFSYDWMAGKPLQVQEPI